MVEFVDEGSQRDIIYTDLSEAFDSNFYNVVLEKCRIYRRDGTVFQWLRFY